MFTYPKNISSQIIYEFQSEEHELYGGKTADTTLAKWSLLNVPKMEMPDLLKDSSSCHSVNWVHISELSPYSVHTQSLHVRQRPVYSKLIQHLGNLHECHLPHFILLERELEGCYCKARIKELRVILGFHLCLVLELILLTLEEMTSTWGDQIKENQCSSLEP